MSTHTTKWVAYPEYGCYYRLQEYALQARPMGSDESACDVDYYELDEDQRSICLKIAAELGNAYWPSEPPRE